MRSTARVVVPLLAASARAAHYEVTVGQGGQLRFDPEVVHASIGDTIRYNFFAKNHSLVESSFAAPCEPLEEGIFSGFVPTDSENTPSATSFTVTVRDTKPHWLYCSQGKHCQSGMAHVINPPASGNNLAGYKSAAADVAVTRSPAGRSPKGGIRRVDVEVGKDGKLEFSPKEIREPLGTVVRFSFHPKNHTVTQAAFDKPCQPLGEGGFHSGFIPVSTSPSGAVFEIDISKEGPMWFYCGQGAHCQTGMVGVINPPANNPERNLDAFISAAKSAPTTTTPDAAPLVGIFNVNGTTVTNFKGPVMPLNIDTDPNDAPTTTAFTHATTSPLNHPPATTTTTSNSSSSSSTHKPPISSQTLPADPADIPPWSLPHAGAGKPARYNWAPSLSRPAAESLSLTFRIEDVLLHLLWEGSARLEPNGSWAGALPPALVDTVAAWTAQSLVQRATAAEVLRRYGHPVPEGCAYRLPPASPDGTDGAGGEVGGGVGPFLTALAELSAAAIGALVDASARVAEADPFLVPLLATQVGAKSRAAGVINMMQSRMASVAPREGPLPAALAWSFVASRFVQECPGGLPEKPWPVLALAGNQVDEDGFVVSVDLEYEDAAGGDRWVAWMGPWGLLEFTKVTESEGRKTAPVPEGWLGQVWIAVVSKKDVDMAELHSHMVAGPALAWVTEL
ncbi:hypothetical protein VTJ83DRAFT_4484 [Remersonia thermophila]|uniref:Blue (type 1) copper domain-containing protein n=1 Tax=Remersonia thermophila TaxID=72144 RepID=A0ABR4DAA0_9PEZI